MSYSLSQDQRRLLNMYMSQYDQTSAHIERLTLMLAEIRENIQQIVRLPNTNTNTNTNRSNQSSRRRRDENNSVFYDYNNPIDRYFYMDVPLNINTNTNTNRTINTTFSDLLSTFFNTNVTVRPTQQQLTNASRIIRYSAITNPLSEACPITLERFEPEQMVTQLLPCEHIFETNGFNNWFESNVRCPVCRYDIRDYRPRTTTSSTTATTTTPTTASNNSGTTSTTAVTRPATTNILTTDASNNRILTSTLLEQLMSNYSNSNERVYYNPEYNYVIYETNLTPPTRRTNSNSGATGANNNNI